MQSVPKSLKGSGLHSGGGMEGSVRGRLGSENGTRAVSRPHFQIMKENTVKLVKLLSFNAAIIVLLASFGFS